MYDAAFHVRITEIITIVILGSMCGLKNVSQIHQWASNDRVSEFLLFPQLTLEFIKQHIVSAEHEKTK